MSNAASHRDHDHVHPVKPHDGGLHDPVCGMAVTPPSTFSELYEGRAYQFCSLKCQEKFRAEPQRYAANSSGTNHSSRTEPAAEPQLGTEFTCPMHPEIRQPGPGTCPKCGMALEPVMPGLEEEENPELKDFTRRFWWSLPLTVIVTVLAMAGHSLQLFHGATQNWVELVLATPVILWAGWPFFCKGRSVHSSSQSKYVDLDRSGYRSGLSLQHCRDVVSPETSRHLHARRTHRRLLRSRRSDHLADLVRADA